MMESNGTAAYNALQVKAGKPLSTHLSFSAFYTFSKSLASEQMDGASTSGGAEDANNLALERGRSDYDQRHNFVAALIWDMSYYKGNSPFMKNLLNGWTLSPIVTLTSGLPFTVSAGKDNNYDGVNNDRANLIGNPVLDPHRSRPQVLAQWFNTAGFRGQPDRHGWHIRAQPSRCARAIANVDMGIFRDFSIRERIKLQFRAEFTNFFNLVSLNAPNATLSSSTVGQIAGAQPMRQLQLGIRSHVLNAHRPVRNDFSSP